MRSSDWTFTTTGYQHTGKTHDQIRELCRFAGFSGIEGVPPLFEEGDLAALETEGGAYKDAGLVIETFHLPFSSREDIAAFYETDRRRTVDTTTRWMERASAAGATVGIQHPTTNPHPIAVEGVDPYLRQMGKSLEALLRTAEGLGFTVAIENMLPVGGQDRLTCSPEHFDRIRSEFGHPNLGFCLDTGHALVARGDEGPMAFLEAMGEDLAAFHLADNPGDRDLHLAPGKGNVDWLPLFRRIREIGYEGSLCIETAPFAHGPDYTAESWRQMVADTRVLASPAGG